MATKFAEGYVRLRADMTKLRRDMAATKALLVKQIRGMEKTTAPLMAGLLSFRNLLGAGGFFAGMQMGREVMTFEDAMAKGTAIMAGAEKRLGELADKARSVAKELGLSHTRMAESYYYLASAGLDATRSLQVLPQVGLFAKAGRMDQNLQRAVDLLTDAQSALGMASDDAEEHAKQMGRLSDVIVRGNELSNASVEQYSEALTNRFGAALKAANKDVEEGVALLAAFAAQGRKGMPAGRTATIWMRDIGRQARENAGAFAQFGIRVYDQQGQMRNFADIIRDLENALGDLSPQAKGAALAQLGLVEISADATKMLLGCSRVVGQWHKELDKAGGATQRVAERNMNSFLEQLKQLNAALTDLLRGVLQPLMDAMRPLIDILTTVTGWITELNDATDGLIGTILAAAAALKVLTMASRAFALSNPILAAITVITAAIIWLVSDWEDAWLKIRLFAVQAAQGWVKIWRHVWGTLKGIGRAMWRFFKNVWQNIRAAAENAGHAIVGAFKAAWEAGKAVLPGGKSPAQAFREEFAREMAKVRTDFVNLGEGVGKAFHDSLQEEITKPLPFEDVVAGLKAQLAGVPAGAGAVTAAAAPTEEEVRRGFFTVAPDAMKGYKEAAAEIRTGGLLSPEAIRAITRVQEIAELGYRMSDKLRETLKPLLEYELGPDIDPSKIPEQIRVPIEQEEPVAAMMEPMGLRDWSKALQTAILTDDERRWQKEMLRIDKEVLGQLKGMNAKLENMPEGGAFEVTE